MPWMNGTMFMDEIDHPSNWSYGSKLVMDEVDNNWAQFDGLKNSKMNGIIFTDEFDCTNAIGQMGKMSDMEIELQNWNWNIILLIISYTY